MANVLRCGMQYLYGILLDESFPAGFFLHGGGDLTLVQAIFNRHII